MILYEVRLDVDAAIADAYQCWLEAHVREILALPGFVSADMLTEPRPPGRVGWCVHYWLRDQAALDAYLRDHAARLRADGLARFPGKFNGERRVLELQQRLVP